MTISIQICTRSGQALTQKRPKWSMYPELHNLDYGFEAYATQGFNAPDGRAYAVSWLGLPDVSYPTEFPMTTKDLSHWSKN